MEIMKIGYFHRLLTFYDARVKDIVHISEKQCRFIQSLLSVVDRQYSVHCEQFATRQTLYPSTII